MTKYSFDIIFEMLVREFQVEDDDKSRDEIEQALIDTENNTLD